MSARGGGIKVKTQDTGDMADVSGERPFEVNYFSAFSGRVCVLCLIRAVII